MIQQTLFQRDSFNNICDKLHKGKITPEEAQQQFGRFLEQNPELKAHEGRFQNILDQLSGKTSAATSTADDAANAAVKATGKAETPAEVHARRQQELNEVFKNYEEPSPTAANTANASANTSTSTADDAANAFSKKDAIKEEILSITSAINFIKVKLLLRKLSSSSADFLSRIRS